MIHGSGLTVVAAGSLGVAAAGLLAFGSGVAAAVYLMRYLGVEHDPVWGRAVFWPTLFIVFLVVYIIGALVLNYVGGGSQQTP